MIVNNSIDKNWSELIKALRFPLIVAVILTHYDVASMDVIRGGVEYINVMGSCSKCVQYFFSHVIGALGVPLFALISGYLFFETEFSKLDYVRKLNKRVKTLLVPYILWNTLYLLFTLGRLFVKIKYQGGAEYDNYEVSLRSILSSYWDCSYPIVWNDGDVFDQPICGPFWFVRDLICFVVFSPLVYILVKYLRIWSCAIMLLLWMLFVPELQHGYHIFHFGLFFFIGAYWRIHNIKPTKMFEKPSLAILGGIIFLGLTVLDIWFKLNELNVYIHRMTVFIGTITVIACSLKAINHNSMSKLKLLASYSFFVFAFHALIETRVGYYVIKLIKPYSEIEQLSLYFVTCIITVLVSMAMYWLVRNIKISSYLTGGR